MCYTNIITIKDIIILEKARGKEKPLENTADITVSGKMA